MKEDNIIREESSISGWKVLGAIFFIIAIIVFCIGIDKLVNVDEYRNRIFQGDVYNYAIGAIRAVAYFVISLICVVISIGCGIFSHLGTKYSDNNDHSKSVENPSLIQEELNNTWCCPNCKTTNNADNAYCNKCGTKKEVLDA